MSNAHEYEIKVYHGLEIHEDLGVVFFLKNNVEIKFWALKSSLRGFSVRAIFMPKKANSEVNLTRSYVQKKVQP